MHSECINIGSSLLRPLTIALFCLSLSVFSGYAQEMRAGNIKTYDDQIQAQSRSLDSIKTELSRGREKLEELNKSEQTSLEQLELLAKNIQNSERYLNQIEDVIDSLSARITGLEISLTEKRSELSYRQKKMEKRLRDMYKVGKVQVLEMFFTANSMADFLNRLEYFQKLRAYDEHLIKEIDSTRSDIAQNKKRLEQQRDLQIAFKEERKEETRALREDREKHDMVLQKIKSEKEAYMEMVEELELAQRQLATLIEKLEKKKERAEKDYQRSLMVKFEKRKGKLPWPVSGEIVKPYGKIVHPVYKTVTVNNGVDIRTTSSADVKSVAPGRVMYIGKMRGLGRIIVLDHYGGYLTIYANLGAVAVQADKDVNYGSILGTVGTGSGQGTVLHFEIRKSTQSLNPGDWLEKVIN